MPGVVPAAHVAELVGEREAHAHRRVRAVDPQHHPRALAPAAACDLVRQRRDDDRQAEATLVEGQQRAHRALRCAGPARRAARAPASRRCSCPSPPPGRGPYLPTTGRARGRPPPGARPGPGAPPIATPRSRPGRTSVAPAGVIPYASGKPGASTDVRRDAGDLELPGRGPVSSTSPPPNRSRVERPSPSGTCGAREPGGRATTTGARSTAPSSPGSATHRPRVHERADLDGEVVDRRLHALRAALGTTRVA